MLHNTVNIVIIGLLFAATTVAAPSTTMPRQSDISSTLHNLSTSGTGTVSASSESQICAFCHTPHGANTAVTPLWNRDLSTETYIPYDSNSIQANIDANPGGPSKLCLSCHDGTLALGNLNVLDGGAATVTMGGTNAGKMPDGSGALTGFTRNLGTDLSGDHPISFSFDASKVASTRLAAADGELRDPLDADGAHIATGSKIAPLDKDGKVQCTTCHDPHVSGQDLPTGTTIGGTTSANNAKFLRARRFQMSAPQGGDFDLTNDIVCLECHDKLGAAWSQSAHADPAVANELYKIESSDQRQFPADIAVWQAACLNCHDTHTVQGANRLLREGTLDGTDTTVEVLLAAKSGGKPALEETCFQCHTTPTQSILKAGSGAPNIETEFGKATRMPLAVYDVNNQEIHDIVDADFNEPQLQLGFGDLSNRHAECTDCHNPHRMIRNSLADGSGVSTKGTHPHTDAELTALGLPTHSNLISGVLKGVSGVEPIYDSGANGRKFGTTSAMPTGFVVKDGLGANAVTKEYQVCFKCHSNYGYDDKGTPDNARLAVTPNVPNDRPETGGEGLTPYVGVSTATRPRALTNSFRNYTNQAMEFQAPSRHACEGNCVAGTSEDGGADFGGASNHRSWHPVVGPTGRTPARRGASANAWLAPWNGGVGDQTMYCTDCHGESTGTDRDVVPNGTTPWGPHGSSNNFILKGSWLRGSAKADSNGLLCFKCHDSADYNGSGSQSAFGTGKGDGHNEVHRSDRIRTTLDCMWCHVALPHGWKNKSFLVNLNDIGPEVMCREVDNDVYNISPACTEGLPIPSGSSIPTNSIGGSQGYDNPPYYVNARLRINSFGGGGSWSESNCGGVDSSMTSVCDRGAGY